MTISDDSSAKHPRKTWLKMPPITKENTKKAAGGAALFLLGFAVNKALDRVEARFFPDQAEAQAQTLQNEIRAKTENIEKLSTSIEEKLKALGADEGFADEAKELLAAIDGLRPDIYKAADMSRETVARLVSAKQNDLAVRGVSGAADIELRDGQGATLCGFGSSFGFTQYGTGSAVTLALSVDGKSDQADLDPGQSLSLPNAQGQTIAVNYQGVNLEAGLWSFDVSCPS